MTIEQLQQANELHEKIKEMSSFVQMLRMTINLQQNLKLLGKPPKKLTSRLRFMNSRGKDKKAEIVFFEGERSLEYGRFVPLDMELIELLHSHFDKRLKAMEAEFANISSATPDATPAPKKVRAHDR